MAKLNENARKAFNSRRRAKPPVAPHGGAQGDTVTRRLSDGQCANGCGELTDGKCSKCGMTYEHIQHAPIPEWML